jgi:uncharacterized protein YegL
MPKFNDDVVQVNAGHFGFSGARPENLSGVEYTLASVIIDTTGSVSRFADDLLKALTTTVEACRKSPRADNLLLRVVTFNSYKGVQEVHGFLPLTQIDNTRYTAFSPNGGTNLNDAVYSSVDASNKYAKILTDQDYLVNGAVYIITDGDDNDSVYTTTQVKAVLDSAVEGEYLESLHTVLIGVNVGQLGYRLEQFQREIGLSQYVDVGDATPNKLAKLSAFVSKSISSQSQALGTGSASQNLTF